LCGLQPPVELGLDDLGIFHQAHDFRPDDIVQQILTHGSVVAGWFNEVPIAIGSQAPVILDLARGRAC
jgi:hypothetical protein